MQEQRDWSPDHAWGLTLTPLADFLATVAPDEWDDLRRGLQEQEVATARARYDALLEQLLHAAERAERIWHVPAALRQAINHHRVDAPELMAIARARLVVALGETPALGDALLTVLGVTSALAEETVLLAEPTIPITRPYAAGEPVCAHHPACERVVQDGPAARCFLCWAEEHAANEED